MLVVGANGFAKQVFEVLPEKEWGRLVFYDDIDISKEKLWEFPILHTHYTAREYFKTIDDQYVLGVGGPLIRYKLFQDFQALGGRLVTLISSKAHISSKVTNIGNGCVILNGATIEGDVTIGKGCIINLNATITHDCTLGDFCEVSPGVRLSGNCRVGEFSFIGTGAVVLPKVVIGENCVIGAGAVVTKDIPAFTKVKGIPAKSD